VCVNKFARKLVGTYLGFEVLTAMVMKSSIFWDLMIRMNSSLHRALLATYFHAGFLHGIFFYPEDGGDMFFRNVDSLLADYTALHRSK
jgi:hypothetical protein